VSEAVVEDGVSLAVVGDDSTAGDEESTSGIVGRNSPSVSNTIHIQAEIHASQESEHQDGVGMTKPCGVVMALLAVESSFSASQLDQYKTACASGSELHLKNDRLYLTWKGLKDAGKEEEGISNMMNTPITSISSTNTTVLESAVALQEFHAILSLDDVENVLAVDNQPGCSFDQQNHIGPELLLPLGTSQSCTTPSRPILMEIFPYQNTSSPADQDADVLFWWRRKPIL